MTEENTKICGSCLLCLHTYLGCECCLTDNSVEYAQDACQDYIEDKEYESDD